jgi:trans-aconitate 2-methyltransferase
MPENPDPREWNAALYHQISAPQVSWGKKVLARISLRGDETVLDAGCGTGRLTRDLLEALPRGHVVGLDLSQNMLDAARAYLEPDSSRDSTASSAPRRFTGYSITNAFFAACIVLCAPVPGCAPSAVAARTSAVCWGVCTHLSQPSPTSNISLDTRSPGNSRMPRPQPHACAGFEEVETSLEEAPTKFSNAQEFQQFVESVILRNHLDRIPDRALRDQFLAELTRQAASDNPAFPARLLAAEFAGKKVCS